MWQTDTVCVLRAPELCEGAIDTEGLHALDLAPQSSLRLCVAHLAHNAQQTLQLCVVEEAREDVTGLCYGAHQAMQNAAVTHTFSHQLSVRANQFASVLMLRASVVYVDSIFLLSQLDKEAGHLSLCALAVLTQQHARQCTDAMSVAFCINDLMWNVFVSVEVVGHVSTLRTPTSANVKTLIACAFASLHAVLDCFAMDMPEMLSRAVLFCVLCSLVMLCSTFAPKSDRSSCSVLLLCASVLFVHVYPAVASVVSIVGLHARLVYRTKSNKHSRLARKFAGIKAHINKQRKAKQIYSTKL